MAASNATSDGAKSVRRMKRDRFGGAPFAVHAHVLPLDRQRAVVADPVQRAEQLVEVDVAVAGRDEVPAAVAVAELRCEPRIERRPSSRRFESLTWTW